MTEPEKKRARQQTLGSASDEQQRASREASGEHLRAGSPWGPRGLRGSADAQPTIARDFADRPGSRDCPLLLVSAPVMLACPSARPLLLIRCRAEGLRAFFTLVISVILVIPVTPLCSL